MIAAIYARFIGTALCWLLALVTSAGAETLWEQTTEVSLPSGFKSLGVFGMKAECLTEARRQAEVAYVKHLRGQYREATLKATPAGGWEVKAPVEFATLYLVYECFPDTVDPREPKGTK
jgi:hypothetical protein